MIGYKIINDKHKKFKIYGCPYGGKNIIFGIFDALVERYDDEFLWVLLYTCLHVCFKDVYTTEILGHAVSSKMDVALIQEAFNNMMDDHKSEFPKDMEVYCHSDQGSQYLSTTFKQLLNENDFIQSMSRRGNSQDNAPMESFFWTHEN